MALNLFAGLAIACLAVPGSQAQAQAHYTAVDLSRDVAKTAYANGMNAQGRIAGYDTQGDTTYGIESSGTTHAVTRVGSFGGSFTQVEAISDTGRAVGCSNDADGVLHAFITPPRQRTLIDLGLIGTGVSGCAEAVNHAGQVAGIVFSSTNQSFGFVTDKGGLGMRDIGSLGFFGFTRPDGINDSGLVVGWSGLADGQYHAFMFDSLSATARMVDLGTLGGSSSQATAVNASGQVVGSAQTANGSSHAFITGPLGQGMRDVDHTKTGQSEFFALNTSGRAVGMTGDRPGQAVISSLDGQSLVKLDTITTLPAKVSLQRANGISDDGRIVAMGTDGHVYLLVPDTAP